MFKMSTRNLPNPMTKMKYQTPWVEFPSRLTQCLTQEGSNIDYLAILPSCNLKFEDITLVTDFFSWRDSPSPGNDKPSKKPVILGNDFGNLPNQVASTDNVTVVDQRTNPRRDTKSAGNTRHVSFKNEDETPAKTRAQVDQKVRHWL